MSSYFETPNEKVSTVETPSREYLPKELTSTNPVYPSVELIPKIRVEEPNMEETN